MNAKVSKLKTDPEALRRRVQSQLDSGMSQTELARLAGTSASTVGRWLAGKYSGDNSKVEHQIASALEAIAEREAQAKALPAAPDYVNTPTTARILDVLGYAHIASDVVVIYGGAGLGKTEAIRHYQASNANVWVVTATPADSGVVSTLEGITAALGIPAPQSAARIHRAICKRMTGTFGLLVVDEAQNLDTKALDQVRAIHDATGCGLALVGNEATYSQLTGGNRAPYLDRLYSRVGQRLRLGKATNADTDAIIEAWGISVKSCIDALRKIAATPGGLRSLTKTLRLASMYAAGDGRAVNCDDIRAAWKRLGGTS